MLGAVFWVLREMDNALKTIFVMFVLLLINGVGSFAQDEMPPTPTNPYSVFEDDTCIAPCWFGLIPGESTTNDVEKMIEQNEDVFWVRRNPDNDDTFNPNVPVIDGWYRLGWKNYSILLVQVIPTLIRMKDGLVYYIGVQAQHLTRLSLALEIYGQPNYVWIHSSSYCHLYLLYTERRVVVEFRTDLMDGQPSSGVLEDDYELAELTYYSPQAAIEMREIESNILNLYLYPPEAPNVGQVPLEIWQEWLVGDDIRPCSETEWDSLPDEIEIPIYPTLTPTTND